MEESLKNDVMVILAILQLTFKTQATYTVWEMFKSLSVANKNDGPSELLRRDYPHPILGFLLERQWMCTQIIGGPATRRGILNLHQRFLSPQNILGSGVIVIQKFDGPVALEIYQEFSI